MSPRTVLVSLQPDSDPSVLSKREFVACGGSGLRTAWNLAGFVGIGFTSAAATQGLLEFLLPR